MPHARERKSMPMGEGSFHFTVDEMAKAAMGQWGAKSQKIRDLAMAIIDRAGIASHDVTGEIYAIHNYVRDTIRYVKDPQGVEHITYPETLAFDIRSGDCDDHATLAAALLGSIGIPTRFVIVQTKPNTTFNHVYLMAQTKGGDWIPLDPIMKDKPAGWQVPNPVRRRIFRINSDMGVGYISDAALFGMCLWGWRFLTGANRS